MERIRPMNRSFMCSLFSLSNGASSRRKSNVRAEVANLEQALTRAFGLQSDLWPLSCNSLPSAATQYFACTPQTAEGILQ